MENSAKSLPHIGIRVDVSDDRAVAFIQDIVIPFQLAKVRENQVRLKAFADFVAKFSLLESGREESAGSFQPSRWLLECLVPGSSMFKGREREKWFLLDGLKAQRILKEGKTPTHILILEYGPIAENRACLPACRCVSETSGHGWGASKDEDTPAS